MENTKETDYEVATKMGVLRITNLKNGHLIDGFKGIFYFGQSKKRAI